MEEETTTTTTTKTTETIETTTTQQQQQPSALIQKLLNEFGKDDSSASDASLVSALNKMEVSGAAATAVSDNTVSNADDDDAKQKQQQQKEKEDDMKWLDSPFEEKEEWPSSFAAIRDFIKRLHQYGGAPVHQTYAFDGNRFTAAQLSSTLSRFRATYVRTSLETDRRRPSIFLLSGTNRVMPMMKFADLVILDNAETTMAPHILAAALPEHTHFISFVLKSERYAQYFPGALRPIEERKKEYEKQGFEVKVYENSKKSSAFAAAAPAAPAGTTPLPTTTTMLPTTPPTLTTIETGTTKRAQIQSSP